MFFSVTLYHTEKFPTVALIKSGMVGEQINRGDPVATQIFHGHIEQLPGDALAAVIRFRIHSANVGGEIFAVVKIIFNHTQATDDLATVKTEIPSVFCFFL